MYLTRSFSERDIAAETDEAMIFAISQERGLRELRFRTVVGMSVFAFGDATLLELVPARDAGDVCHVCFELVTWVDHLPPQPGGVVRCLKNVLPLERGI